MISSETASRIWHCHREIAAAEQLIIDIQESLSKQSNSPGAGSLTDHFGRQRNLQLGVPSGQDAHRLFNVSPKLALSVIRAHIENKRAELAEASEQARLELGPDFIKQEAV